MNVSGSVRHRSSRRTWRAFAPVLVALTLVGIGVAVLLAVTPLNEFPDTYCESLWSHTPGDSCNKVYARRTHWIVVVLAVTLVLGVAAAVAYTGRGSRSATCTRWYAALLLALGIGCALGGAAFLTVGVESGRCGSTLSRVDEFGSYDADTPTSCASGYAIARHAAQALGGGAVVLAVIATFLGSRTRDRVVPDTA